MQKANENITYSFSELVEVLKELELILQSLHRMGAYYGVMSLNNEKAFIQEYEKETTRFIDEGHICERLAKMRQILTTKFDRTLGEDDMDDLERIMLEIKHWNSPGDTP